MKLTFENFGRAHIVRFEDAAGPLKLLIGGNDGLTVLVDPSGHVVVIQPEGPVENYQQDLELMRIAKSTVPTAGRSPYVSSCESLYARIAAIENEITDQESYGMDTKGLRAQLSALRRAAQSGRCRDVRLDPNSDD
ncbi:hypothetical protein [Burkholderia ubonensis]|uniref:hypothetical protein n=1 Tax=Burkholderia ubonensis TaxID=101571 RepID=UPI000753149E|nr:hypothetical protein [Burkholderia ubonensis]KVP48409.1 hypothetical protein WJ90_15000 [Burkholderia ubonensis]